MKFDYILTPAEIRDKIDNNLLNDFGSIIELSEAYDAETGDAAPDSFAEASDVLLDWITEKPYNDIMTELYALELLPDVRLIEYTLKVVLNNGGSEIVEEDFATDKLNGADALRAWREYIAANTGLYWTISEAEPRRLLYTAGSPDSPIKSIEYIATAIL